MGIYSAEDLYKEELTLIDRIRYLVGEGVDLEKVLKSEEKKLKNQIERNKNK